MKDLLKTKTFWGGILHLADYETLLIRGFSRWVVINQTNNLQRAITWVKKNQPLDNLVLIYK